MIVIRRLIWTVHLTPAQVREMQAGPPRQTHIEYLWRTLHNMIAQSCDKDAWTISKELTKARLLGRGSSPQLQHHRFFLKLPVETAKLLQAHIPEVKKWY